MGKKDRGKGKASPRTGKTERLGAPKVIPKLLASRAESYPPIPRNSPNETGVTRGGHHPAPRLRPDQCTLCRQLNIEQLIAPNEDTRLQQQP